MLIKKLLKEKYCFSIMKSYSSLKKSSGYRNAEYEILALMEDYKDLEEYGFETNQNTSECPVSWLNPDGVISKIMSSEEVVDFLKYEIEFKEVFNHPKNGIIYELKRQSFKEVHSRLIKTIIQNTD